MGITFNSAHMRTLVKLNEIAQKHNCVINFGFEEVYDEVFDFDGWCKDNDVPEDVREEIVDYINLDGNKTYGAKYWFELIDKTDSEHYKHHTFAYNNLESLAFFDEDDIGEMSSFAQDWFNENVETCYPLLVRNEDVTLCGWEGFDTSEAYRCYRPGMCLKFFGDLVCDYLHEERIVETY